MEKNTDPRNIKFCDRLKTFLISEHIIILGIILFYLAPFLKKEYFLFVCALFFLTIAFKIFCLTEMKNSSKAKKFLFLLGFDLSYILFFCVIVHELTILGITGSSLIAFSAPAFCACVFLEPKTKSPVESNLFARQFFRMFPKEKRSNADKLASSVDYCKNEIKYLKRYLSENSEISQKFAEKLKYEVNHVAGKTEKSFKKIETTQNEIIQSLKPHILPQHVYPIAGDIQICYKNCGQVKSPKNLLVSLNVGNGRVFENISMPLEPVCFIIALCLLSRKYYKVATDRIYSMVEIRHVFIHWGELKFKSIEVKRTRLKEQLNDLGLNDFAKNLIKGKPKAGYRLNIDPFDIKIDERLQQYFEDKIEPSFLKELKKENLNKSTSVVSFN